LPTPACPVSERLLAAGLPLGRAVFGVDTLHPVLEGRVFHFG
jgi:hypothetical protein